MKIIEIDGGRKLNGTINKTNTALPAIIAGTVAAFGAMPSKNANTGDNNATVRPLAVPHTNAVIANMALTQEPVTI